MTLDSLLFAFIGKTCRLAAQIVFRKRPPSRQYLLSAKIRCLPRSARIPAVPAVRKD
jgi:hypothetical protein